MSSDADRYARLNTIVCDALEHAAGADREAYLARACRDDPALRADAEALLRADENHARGAFAETRLAAVRASLEDLADDATSAWVPERIGSYTIIRRIGEGGMGIVYEATQQSPERAVAVKLLHPIQVTPDRLRRFHREAELLGRLRHPGIVQVFEAGMYDVGRGPQPFFAMELIDGLDVRSHCERRGLDHAARIELLAQICDAVHYAHEHGIVHRDLKPDNVLVDDLGKPRVLDFGVARATGSTAMTTMLTREGQLVGTLAYMAPEQLDQAVDEVTPQADVYALGVLGFELLVGRVPRILDDLSLTKAITLLCTSEPPRAGSFDAALRGDVETILGKALESEPERRYESAAALAGDLRRHLGHLPIQARPPSRMYLVRKFSRRHRGLVGGVVVAMIAMLIGTVVAIVYAQRATTSAELAAENERRAINGLHQSAQVLIDAGRERAALSQLWLVPEAARGFAWQLVRRATPAVMDLPIGEYGFLDDEHIVGRDATTPNGLFVHSLVDGTSRELFENLPIRRLWDRPGREGFAVVDDGSEYLLLDLTNEAIVGRSKNWDLEGEFRQPAGQILAGHMLATTRHRIPETSDDGRTTLWWTSAGTAEVRVDGQVVRAIREIGLLEGVHIGRDGRDLVVNRRDQVTVVDIASGDLRFCYRCDDNSSSGTPVVGGVVLHNAPETDRSISRRVWRRFELPDAAELLEPVDPFAAGFVIERMNHPPFCSYPRDGRFVVVRDRRGGARSTQVADTRTGQPLTFAALIEDYGQKGVLPFPEHGTSYVDVSPTGRRLLIHSQYGKPAIVEFDAREREPGFDPRCVTLRGHTNAAGSPGSGWIYHLAVSNDGSLIASAAPEDPRIRVWDARTGENVATLARNCAFLGVKIPGTWDALMAFGPSDEHLFVTTPYGDQGLCLLDWDLLTGEVSQPVPPRPRDASHLELLDDFIAALAPAASARLSQRVQLGGEHAYVAFHLPTPGMAMSRPPAGRRWRYIPDSIDKASGLAVHPGGSTVAVVRQVGLGASGHGILTVIDAGSGEVLVERELAHKPWCAGYAPDGSTLAVGANDGHVLLFETGRYTQVLDWPAHVGARYDYIYSLAWTPDGTRLVTASGDETVKVWDTRTRVASRLDDERWQELRRVMVERNDFTAGFGAMTADERQAARIERIRRAHRR